MAELDSQPKSIQSIYSWYSESKLFVNRRYQRKLVWTQVEKQKLIESVLKRYPVPAVLLAERETGDYEVIDGLQRLHTLVSFIENSFPAIDGKFFDVSQFPTARSRADEGAFEIVSGPDESKLTPKEVSTFLDYSLAVSVMRGATEAEIDDVFSRINTYGHRLSDQERRQAGVQGEFSNLVRELSCELRGDASSDILPLANMPAISIDLPKTKHGYSVVADEVFWVNQGILRSTDLRDSMDEQCIADIAASIVGGQIVDRSKETLDDIYQSDSVESKRISTALDIYGEDRFKIEFKHCVDELLKVCDSGEPKKLRSVLFKKKTTNPFPSAFAVLMIALHEALISGQRKIASYDGVKTALTDLSDRIETSRKSTTPEQRRKNVDTIKGLIDSHLVPGNPLNYGGSHSSTDIDSIIRRSEIELPHYELKQGILRLDDAGTIDENVFSKVVNTICAIANNGRGRSGTILIGVSDNGVDATRVAKLYELSPRKVSARYVVGVSREARKLGESTESYFARWKGAVRNSGLTDPLRESVLSAMDFNDYFGLGVIAITVPEQQQLSFVNGKVFAREGDETVEVTEPQAIVRLAGRF
ncbi:GmrSD restriction endonuclease domain-containing protein [Saccharothrix australiensis]|nr:DUF262 domain-containing protein [Saccharothrix australiensis]